MARYTLAFLVTLTLFGSTRAAHADFTTEVSGENSGKCVDVEGNSTADGANVIQWTCHSGANQQMNFRLVPPTTDTYTVVFQHSGKCLDVAGASLVAGANVQQWTCNNTSAQRFRVEQRGSNFALINVNSGKLSKSKVTLSRTWQISSRATISMPAINASRCPAIRRPARRPVHTSRASGARSSSGP